MWTKFDLALDVPFISTLQTDYEYHHHHDRGDKGSEVETKSTELDETACKIEVFD